jgi:hypothetical protein
VTRGMIPPNQREPTAAEETPFEECQQALQREQARFDQRQTIVRRTAWMFFPFYLLGGVLYGWGLVRVDDLTTGLILGAGFLLLLTAQWGQPYWQERLNRKRESNDE